MFRAPACFCLLQPFFLEKWKGSGLPSIPQMLMLHWFSNLALLYDAKEQRSFVSAISLFTKSPKIWKYHRDRNSLAHCWQKSSFCSSSLHSLHLALLALNQHLLQFGQPHPFSFSQLAINSFLWPVSEAALILQHCRCALFPKKSYQAVIYQMLWL